MDSHNDQPLVGLKSHLEEQCGLGIAELRVRVPIQTWTFKAFLATT